MNVEINQENSVQELTSDHATWHNASILSVNQLTQDGLRLLYDTACSMRDLVRSKGGDKRLEHKMLATVFYEASTRTACSFQAAMKRLGGEVIHVDAGKGGNTSAGKKGETLTDTINCLECYVDVTVLRHPVEGSVRKAASKAVKPIVNAGDGVGEHPTQALLDLYTIWNELGLDRCHSGKLITVVLVGDLKHGRTVHSLSKLLARSGMQNILLRFCNPPSLAMPEYIKTCLKKYSNITVEEIQDLNLAIEGADILYVTRVQKERFHSESEYDAVKGAYVVDLNLIEKAPDSMIIMHPLPRVDEISPEVDTDPRAAYFRQMENGMFVRMAILALILGKG